MITLPLHAQLAPGREAALARYARDSEDAPIPAILCPVFAEPHAREKRRGKDHQPSKRAEPESEPLHCWPVLALSREPNKNNSQEGRENDNEKPVI